MTQDLSKAILCPSFGFGRQTLECCSLEDQQSPICDRSFTPHAVTFRVVCLPGNCIEDCSNVTHIYRSSAQTDAYVGDNSVPIRRFRTCANVPAMAGFLSQNLLDPGLNRTIGTYIPRDASDESLKKVTHAVTECLISTCRNARENDHCLDACSAVNMLTNSTTPDIMGVDKCLSSLCNGGYSSLPYADADVVGIGVFMSYIIQCFFVVGLFFALAGVEFSNRRSRRRKQRSPATEPLMEESETSHSQSEHTNQPKKDVKTTHRSLLEDLIVEFHQAQCYFSITLQIASLTYGIFETNILIVYMLTPLATNGVLPVVIGYILLLRCKKASLEMSLLTSASWLLSTIVYWVLYSHIVPINNQIHSGAAVDRRYRAYQQFMYKLSSIDACGGYSALATCPDNNFALGFDELVGASTQLRYFTPMLWTFSTFCFFVVLGNKIMDHLPAGRKKQNVSQDSEAGGAKEASIKKEATSKRKHGIKVPNMTRRRLDIVYYITMLVFLAGIAMQLSLLSIGSSLEMMDVKHWSFGQVVAVTIWVPPLLNYVYCEVRSSFRNRRGKVDDRK